MTCLTCAFLVGFSLWLKSISGSGCATSGTGSGAGGAGGSATGASLMTCAVSSGGKISSLASTVDFAMRTSMRRSINVRVFLVGRC